jgi:hypothetical protein
MEQTYKKKFLVLDLPSLAPVHCNTIQHSPIETLATPMICCSAKPKTDVEDGPTPDPLPPGLDVKKKKLSRQEIEDQKYMLPDGCKGSKIRELSS